jgi:MoaA/NifB/PqqE/SkfB family radical SAM enzyme
MYSSTEVRTIHLELTTLCNARCPMCLRTILGGQANTQLPITELSLNDIKRIFYPEFLKQLKKIYLCGNYGDPAAAKDTLEIFEYFRQCNPNIHLSMFTNGGLKPTQWWAKLAKATNSVRFAIDGLEDTNHIYRRGVSWAKLMESVTSFINSGGNAEWDFIVFEHNESQVETARKLATDLGFKKFFVKKTGRFFSNIKLQKKESQEVWGRDGNIDYHIYPPNNPIYQNQALATEASIQQKYGSMEAYLDQTPINCKAVIDKSVYVSAEGLVFPCCWTANQMYPWYFKPRASQIWTHIEKNLSDNLSLINALELDIRDIINSEWIQSSFANSWNKKSVALGKLKVCAKTCGASFDPFLAQFTKSSHEATKPELKKNSV